MKMPRIALSFIWLIIATSHVSGLTEVLFSPNDRPTARLLECIKNSRKRIYAAVYMLTDKVIAQALIDAKTQRNIDVQVVVDKISYESIFGKGKLLEEKGVPLFIFEPVKKTEKIRAWGAGPIMHHKFALFDNILWTGSFNWTVSANRSNQENVIITDDVLACRKYENQFESLKKTSLKKRSFTQFRKEPNVVKVFINVCKSLTPKSATK